MDSGESSVWKTVAPFVGLEALAAMVGSVEESFSNQGSGRIALIEGGGRRGWWEDSRWLDGGRNDAASVGCALLLICWMIELAARAFWKLAEGFEQFPWRGYGSWRERSRWNFAKCFEFGSYSVLTLLRHGWRSLVALWYTPSTASLVENLPSVYSCALWGIAMACFTIVRMRCCRSPKSHRMRRGTTSSHQAPFWRTKQVFFLSIRVLWQQS